MSELPAMNMNTETGCCPKFEPELWDEKIFEFDDLIFAKAYTKSIFYMPLNMGKVMTNSMKLIDASSAQPNDKYLILSHDISPWKCEQYFLVTKDVYGMEMVKLKGSFMAKVFEGEFKEVPNWMKEMKSFLIDKGIEAGEMYSFYTTCPKCAKHYGKNYVVLFAKMLLIAFP